MKDYIWWKGPYYNEQYFLPLGHRISYIEEKKKSTFKMALRTICTFALRNGTDLRVNNTRTIVTTGTAMAYFSNYYIVLKCGNIVSAFVSSVYLHL